MRTRDLVIGLVAVFFCMLLIFFLFDVNTANADTLKFSWTPNTDSTEGYNLMEVIDGDSSVLIQKIPGAETSTVSIEAENTGKRRYYFLTAYAGDQVSDPSDIAVWNPSSVPVIPEIPNNPRTFLITITPVEN